MKRELNFEIITENGLNSNVNLYLEPQMIKMEIKPVIENKYTILARTGGIGPAYGMGDLAAFGEGSSDLILQDFIRDPAGGNNGRQRMISNFVIFPKQEFAEVNVEPSSSKMIHIFG